MKLESESMADVDIISWVPISGLRRLKRGYDQSKLLAKAVGKELGITPLPVLRKIRHTKPQSSLAGEAFRRANISGAYKVVDIERIAGKRILLLDDVVTTGATASECARMLITYGAKEVYIAAIAAAENHKK
jgi:predicted amidophosphoribosyltransferase